MRLEGRLHGNGSWLLSSVLLWGALVSWCLVQFCLVFLSGPVELIAQSYRDDYALFGLSGTETIVLFALGSILGICGAALTVSKHLHTLDKGGT